MVGVIEDALCVVRVGRKAFRAAGVAQDEPPGAGVEVDVAFHLAQPCLELGAVARGEGIDVEPEVVTRVNVHAAGVCGDRITRREVRAVVDSGVCGPCSRILGPPSAAGLAPRSPRSGDAQGRCNLMESEKLVSSESRRAGLQPKAVFCGV